MRSAYSVGPLTRTLILERLLRLVWLCSCAICRVNQESRTKTPLLARAFIRHSELAAVLTSFPSCQTSWRLGNAGPGLRQYEHAASLWLEPSVECWTAVVHSGMTVCVTRGAINHAEGLATHTTRLYYSELVLLALAAGLVLRLSGREGMIPESSPDCRPYSCRVSNSCMHSSNLRNHKPWWRSRLPLRLVLLALAAGLVPRLSGREDSTVLASRRH